MSWKHVEWARKQNTGHPYAKLVLVCLAQQASDRTGLAWRSLPDLAADTELHRRTVMSYVGRLKRAGLIEETEQRRGDTGRIKVYRLGREQARLALPEPPKQGSRGALLNRPTQFHHSNGGEQGAGDALLEAANSAPGVNGSLSRHEIGQSHFTQIEMIEEAKASSSKAAPVTVVLDAWNRMAAAANLPTAKKLTPSRRKSLNARLKEFGLPAILRAIEAVPRSSFLTGGGPRGWKADFDFLCGNRLTNLIEGRYENRPGDVTDGGSPLARLINEGRA